MEADPEKSFVEEVCLPFLRNAQNMDGGWGFHPQSQSRVEPTCWALQALAESLNREAGRSRRRVDCNSFAPAQLADGSWPSTPEEKSGCWVTSLSCWVLLAASDSSPAAAAGLRWLCHDWPRDTTPWRRFLSKFSSTKGLHPINMSYRGWGWTPGTSSWVEPTSFALISLEQASRDLLPPEAIRRRELATAMLVRPHVPGRRLELRQSHASTASQESHWSCRRSGLCIALRHDPTRPENVMSLDWLERSIANIRSAGSLALARICLETYGRKWPADAPRLADLYERSQISRERPGRWRGVAWLSANGRAGWARIVRKVDVTMRDHTLIPSFQRPPSKVVIRRAANYEQDLSLLIQESLSVFNPPVKDKTVLLKPNMVGLDPLGVINTHPAVIAAARECFLRLGAAQVLIGDGPAMDRDTEAIVESVRLRDYAGPLA